MAHADTESYGRLMRAHARPFPAPHERIVRRPSGSAAISVLAAATAVSVPFMVLAWFDRGSLQPVWNNIHWTISAVGAATAVGLSIRGSVGRTRSVRRSTAIALGLWMFATLAWAWMSLTGSPTVPSIADLFIAAVTIPGLAVLVGTVHGRLSSAEETAVYLDATLGFLLIGSLLVWAAGPTAVANPTFSSIEALVYPTVFLGLAAAGLIGILAVGYPLSRRGALPLFVGTALIGLAYVSWIAPSIDLASPSQLSSHSFTIGTLVVAWGAVTWDDRISSSARYLSFAREATRIIAPTVASLLFLLVLVPTDPSIAGVMHVAIFAASIVFIFRQGLLLRERTAVLAQLRTLTDENGRLVGELQVELQRRAADEKRMVQASRLAAVGELAAGVAHEVNNPLTGVLGYAEILLLELDENDPHRPDLETIRDEALRARTIVRALRDFASRQSPALAPADLGEVVHQTVDLIRYATERRDVVIGEDFEPLPPALIDRNAIQQAILNILSNASQAIDGSGRIDVVVRAEGDQQVVAITDDGVGMDAATVRLALEPFFSGRQAAAGGPAPTGLGLSISNGLIESHGGSIAIHSKPGEGTTVEVRLPANGRDAEPTAPADGRKIA